MAESTSTNTSPEQIKFAGDVNIASLTISSLVTGNKFDISHQVAGIHIFEDMFSPFITGSLSFMESLDFAANFPFVDK